MVSIADIDAYQGGGSTADFVVKTANSARNFACDLYRNYPSSIIPNPIDSFVRGLWDGLCGGSDGGVPDPPAPPFTGGQCVGTAYKVACDWDLYNAGSFDHTEHFETIYVAAIVKTVDSGNPIPGKSSVGAYVVFQFPDGSTTQADAGLGFYPTSTCRNLRNIVVTRIGGAPDTCGDPPPKWPNQTTTPPGTYTGDGDITLVDGSTVKIGLGVTIPTGGINFPPVIAVTAPTVSVVNNVTLNFDFGGLHFDAPGAGATKQDLDNLRDKINIDNKTPAPPPSADTHNVDPPDPDGDGDKKQGLDKLDYVKITLTAIAPNANVLYGNNGSPNVYIGAGWIEFLAGDFAYQRQPIQFVEAFFKAPEGCDGFSYTLAVGYQGNAQAFRRKAAT